ncbi:DUF1634 domain-containing protein [Thermoproteus tenax]|uniref:Membrane protein n=1 Tax=Thermoproteus tenax (strain ATCC 35583 / DSM 2078 / JCM 9277 / NBRC 100435 / Kra 1) TaxID=768679 RepID=G4RM82_THETK|nr:DUF1634 domain-containing protein [Thermoproteus tenax]CCC82677.1 putative membrane protein [Thermoproteus tenax Kra 1]
MELEDIIGYTLRIGVLVSIALVIAGLVVLFANPSNSDALSQLSTPHSLLNSSRIQPSAVFAGITRLNGVDIMMLGLIVLIATPIVRVAMGLIQFIKEKNYIYVAITSIVLFNLFFAIFIIPILLK